MFSPCASAGLADRPLPLIGVAGVPRELAASRDYDRIFEALAANGIELFFPTFQYVEAPQSRSLGYETDFTAPCAAEDPAFTALRAHGVRLIVPASLLYDPAQPLPPLDSDPLAALIACAGADAVFGVLSYDEPAHSGVPVQATQALYERIKAVAPELPVLMVHAPLRVEAGAPDDDAARSAYLAGVEQQSRAADIVGFDTYAVPPSIQRVGAPPAGNRVVDAETAVEGYLDFIKRVAPGKRYLSVIQNFSPADQYAPEMLALFPPELRAEARPPTKSELEGMLRAAVDNGASVIVWYGGGFIKSEGAPEWRGTLDVSAELGGKR
jgi:hypothetical protein